MESRINLSKGLFSRSRPKPSANVCAVLLLWLFGITLAQAATVNRTALVIGNSTYDSRLPNPERDARAVAKQLEGLGFQVILKTNADYEDMLEAVDTFADRLAQRQGLGLFYYAGHGIQSEGTNYLIPVGAKIDKELHLKSRTLSFQSVLDQMGAARNGINVAILDACRDNPLTRSWSRSAARGLAATGQSPSGTLIIYSTGAGQTADDGDGTNSPFTTALLQHLGTPFPINQMFSAVGQTVAQQSGGRQTPNMVSSLYEPIILASGSIEQYSPPITPAAPKPPVSTPSVSTPSGLTRLEIKSEPAGATLFLDGNYVGGLPQSLTLPAGKVVTLEARLSGYETVRQPTTIPNTGSKQVTLMLDRIETAATPSYSAPASSSYSGSSDAGSASNTWTNSLGMEFVEIPAGSFQMGSSNGSSDEKPVHTVQIRKSFRLMTTEVTVGQFRRFVESEGYRTEAERGDGCYVWTGSWDKQADKNWRSPGFSQSENDPVACVSWNDVKAMIAWLNRQGEGNYRLPSEAEWEYACRGGRSGDEYCGGDVLDQFGWYSGNSGGRTHPVGQKQANDYGLYDMSGNVWEWVEDWYHDSYGGHPGTESAWTSGGGDYRVLRGGSWFIDPEILRAALRVWNDPSYRDNDGGFRLVQGR